MTTNHEPRTTTKWLHRWAVLTAVAVFPLVLSGGSVTSLRVGMADPEWPTPPWYLLAISRIQAALERGWGFLVEHGHRQIGWLVGVMVLVLTLWLWRTERRRWVRWLGVIALAAVSLQGILGGLRVILHARLGLELAMIHGAMAQFVFCLLCVMAAITSRSWQDAALIETDAAGKFQRLSLALSGLIVIQLLLGIWLRQVGTGVIAHVVLAFGIAAHAVMLARQVYSCSSESCSVFRRPVAILTCLIGVQVGLGLATWSLATSTALFEFQPALNSVSRTVLATTHVGIGALVLATAVVLALRSYRHLLPRSSELHVGSLPVGTREAVA